MRAARMACVVLAAVALPALLTAKGRTVKIVVTGGGLAEPVELTGAEVGKFNVWAGPGVAVNGVPQMKGFIADWEQGAVGERPEGRPVYELSFWVARDNDTPRLAYVVTYYYDSGARKGFVTVAGPTAETHEMNRRSIYRGMYDGKRYRATRAWDDFVRPVMEGYR